MKTDNLFYRIFWDFPETFIETIIIHKLPLKSREEIEAMLDLQDLKQTKVYQEAFIVEFPERQVLEFNYNEL